MSELVAGSRVVVDSPGSIFHGDRGLVARASARDPDILEVHLEGDETELAFHRSELKVES